jgi:hypothetical protein
MPRGSNETQRSPASRRASKDLSCQLASWLTYDLFIVVRDAQRSAASTSLADLWPPDVVVHAQRSPAGTESLRESAGTYAEGESTRRPPECSTCPAQSCTPNTKTVREHAGACAGGKSTRRQSLLEKERGPATNQLTSSEPSSHQAHTL